MRVMRWLRPVAHIGALLPLAVLLVQAATNDLTANPIQFITLRTGKTALVLLMLSLAVTPATVLFGWYQIKPLRRIFGLYAFMYAALHFLIFVGLDYAFDPVLLREAIFEKRYALVGFAAFLLLIPLAVTSTRGWIKRLGRRWVQLHRLVYVAALLVVVHYTWLVKSDVRVPLAFGAVIVGLLLLRLPAVTVRLRHLRRQWSE
jgi:sulfoxide reductase heme-binding subunit YedZ